jgi:hypothetical protein
MVKQLMVAVFFSFLSLASALSFADTASYDLKTLPLNVALNQSDINRSVTSTNKEVGNDLDANINVIKTQNAVVQPQENNSGWLLAFALFGFIMLSNRRDI